MAKKKIVIKDKPEETDAEVATAADETVSEETNSPDPDTSVSEAQPDPEVEQPSSEPAPEESAQEVEADTSLSEPSAVLSKEQDAAIAPKHENNRRRYQLVAIVLMLILAIAGMFLLLEPSNPLPKTDTKLAKFKVYYPKSNSSGYAYAAGSASFTAGQLTYSLEPKNNHVGAGGPIIRITEQALQGQGPNLNALTDFTILKEPAGNAAIGNNGDIVNGVIVTKKTLIIVNGIDGATKQDVLTIMKSM